MAFVDQKGEVVSLYAEPGRAEVKCDWGEVPVWVNSRDVVSAFNAAVMSFGQRNASIKKVERFLKGVGAEPEKRHVGSRGAQALYWGFQALPALREAFKAATGVGKIDERDVFADAAEAMAGSGFDDSDWEGSSSTVH